jgi:hypothetical protein
LLLRYTQEPIEHTGRIALCKQLGSGDIQHSSPTVSSASSGALRSSRPACPAGIGNRGLLSRILDFSQYGDNRPA